MDASCSDEASHRSKQIHNLLRASFDEYEFSPVPGKEIPLLLHPFRLDHVVSIVRRYSSAPLNSLRPHKNLRQIGLSDGGTADSLFKKMKSASREIVSHIFPFVPTCLPFGGHLKLLLFSQYPIALSFRIRPTRLTKFEEAFLDDQIAQCEECFQSIPPMRTTLRLQAHIYEQLLMERLYGMRNNAAMGAIEIASPQPIPDTVIDAVGSLITEASGGTLYRLCSCC